MRSGEGVLVEAKERNVNEEIEEKIVDVLRVAKREIHSITL